MDVTTTSVSKPFIKVAEIWVPKDGLLVNAASDCGCSSEAFAKVSVRKRFSLGEGLSGKAWKKKAPVVLKEFDGSCFNRTTEPGRAWLASVVAIPVFAGEELKAVLVILCGSETDHKGAIEVWQGIGGALALADDSYASATNFESISNGTSFGFGQGLPGAVWAANTPILAGAESFIPSAHASAISFKAGLGLPVPLPGNNPCVVTLLSASNAPIARRFEIWDARLESVGTTRKARLIGGLCEREGALRGQQNLLADCPMSSVWKGPIGQVLGTGLPYVQRNGRGLPSACAFMFALPIYRESELAFIVACYV